MPALDTTEMKTASSSETSHQSTGNMPQDVSMLYKSVISERKAMLVLQLTLMAKKSRTSAPKLQKALVGICRICESHLATYLVLKHYHSRIASGKQELQSQSRLSIAVESVQFEMFSSSLLESQRLVLRPCLIEHIHPCLKEVLDQIHVDHSQQLMLGFRIDIFCQLLFYGCWATNRLLPAHQQP
ncbi:hypothetical protein D5086_005430 [Populus alba]|uniref:Uncharacterized protein n=1 Tax=Populus alba TaxID=43335 RepID=A0ACC4CUH8_POPAL